uniref:Hypotheticial protein n=1 Tax=Schistosoma japonicum TaxID=6182 RepID=C1LN54_SCHJA|nr:hypotheticial protein [Schistosoma japonicum]CAX70949.1 hypotheticial protein [Schistosoma japonicum]CAX76130.1 hypotheticial protein [Schistosoma japonicum]CAX76131.1 hypotheticial protein [Schistosoma japonicum]CAX76132.1 hypotheticial protein [Schistosoma japonicum]
MSDCCEGKCDCGSSCTCSAGSCKCDGKCSGSK